MRTWGPFINVVPRKHCMIKGHKSLHWCITQTELFYLELLCSRQTEKTIKSMWHATSTQANPQPLSPAGLNAQRVSGTLDACCSAVVLTKSSQSSLCAGVDAVTVLSLWTLLPLKPGNLRALEREQAIQQAPTAQKERYVKRVNLKLCRHTYDVKNAKKI